MMRFLLRRSLTLLATVLAASAVIFAALDVLPGNIAQVLLGPDASQEAVQALAQQLGWTSPHGSATPNGWAACCTSIWA